MAKKKSNAQRVSASAPVAPAVNTGRRLQKAVDDDEEEEEEDDDDGEEEEEEDDKPAFVKKSQIPLDDLEKGLAALEEASQPTPSRKSELLEKAKVDRLSRTERNELDALMDGNRLTERVAADDTLAKAMDVSPALDELATKVCEAIDNLHDSLEKSMHSGDERFAALSQTVLAMGDVLKALVENESELRESIDQVLDAPARAPRAEEKPINKALDRPSQGAVTDGEATVDPKMSKRQLIHVLEMMHSDSMSKSLNGNSRSGLPIKSEMAMVMSDQPLSPQMAMEVAAFIKTQMGAQQN